MRRKAIQPSSPQEIVHGGCGSGPFAFCRRYLIEAVHEVARRVEPGDGSLLVRVNPEPPISAELGAKPFRQIRSRLCSQRGLDRIKMVGAVLVVADDLVAILHEINVTDRRFDKDDALVIQRLPVLHGKGARRADVHQADIVCIGPQELSLTDTSAVVPDDRDRLALHFVAIADWADAQASVADRIRHMRQIRPIIYHPRRQQNGRGAQVKIGHSRSELAIAPLEVGDIAFQHGRAVAESLAAHPVKQNLAWDPIGESRMISR